MSMKEIYDVIVIGGGPAGMMATGRAAEQGARVLLLEKNESLGKKLLITGGGRCNVTNAEADIRVLLEKFKEASPFLFSPFSQWNNHDALNFFESRGMKTKIENEGRVFPVSDSAQSVWNVMQAYIKNPHVTIKYHASAQEIITEHNRSVGVRLTNGTIYHAKNVVLATGGKSRPETGSTGDGFSFLKKLGHTIIEPSVSLVPVVISDAWVKKLQGVSLDKVRISIVQNNQKQVAKIGRLLFTHFGITGPTVLNMSKDISEYLKYGPVDITLDLFPGVDLGVLNKKLTELFHRESNKHIKNILMHVVPNAMIEPILEMAEIDPKTPCHSITREERMRIISVVKSMTMRVSGLLGTDKAIITSGGIPLSEIDTKTMASKIIPNIFIVGDLIDIDRPSGGYSLQLCWTTGFVAGSAISVSK